MKNNCVTGLILLCMLTISCRKEVKTTEQKEIATEEIDSTLVVEETTMVTEEEEEKIEEKEEEPKAKPKTTTKKKEKEPTGPGIPSFSGSEAKKYIRDYERYVRNYKKAVEAKDMESFLKLNKASSALSKQYNSLISKLPPEEIQKLSTYMRVKTNQLDQLSKQMQ